jgi:diguanylate cyclase (GGDEF)-like protein
MGTVQEFMRRFPRWQVTLGSFLLVALLGVADYVTGSELGFSIFYLVPISLAILAAGRTLGLVVSCVSAAVWLVADVTGGAVYSQWLIPFWNASVRLGYFTLHSFLLASLLDKIEEEKTLARIDPLTGAANWRFFEEFAAREIQRSHRSKKPMTVAYFDLDNFKAVNDTLGHAAGDELLRTLARTIRNQIRPTDLFARMGGDEFVILFPETGFPEANHVLQRIRDVVLSGMMENGWRIGLSIGATTFASMPSTVEAMVKRSDELMYLVKRDGKNTIKHEQWPDLSTVV